MIEAGLVMLIQTALSGSPPSLIVPGGFDTQLPKDTISDANPMAWSYRSIVSIPLYAIGGWLGFTEWHVQIDCHGNTAADKIHLARAIDNVLRAGFNGNLLDPDRTYVFGIFRLGPQVDGFSDANRSYVRSLEYAVQYQQV